MQQLDERIVQLGIEINGQINTYQSLAITASGTKFANALQNECQITITNLNKQNQDYILSETSPYNLNRTPKQVILSAGRQSYGVSQIYVGNVAYASPTQPPDIGVVLKCLTGNFQKGNILAQGRPSQISLFQVSQQIAQDLKTSLTFQAGDRLLSNASFTGGALRQVNQLGFTGGVNVFIDDNTLVVKNAGVALNNTLTVVNLSMGMIEIPQITEWGVRVKFLLDNKTTLGGGLRIQSQQYPAIDGDYVIYKLGFELSNRDVPFYWIAEASRQMQ